MLATKMLGDRRLRMNWVRLDELIGAEEPGSAVRRPGSRDSDYDADASEPDRGGAAPAAPAAAAAGPRSKLDGNLTESAAAVAATATVRPDAAAVLGATTARRATAADVRAMIRLAVDAAEYADDLDMVARAAGPARARDLARLARDYGLGSRADGPGVAVTLPRVCLRFPLLACSYLPFARRTAVPYERMRRISKDYPRPMMHAAFAYLIPDSGDEYCALLTKAHMLHEYAFHLTVSGVPHRDVAAVRDARALSRIVAYTRAAVRSARFDRGAQIAFLAEHRLIDTRREIFTVSAEVTMAALVWDKEMRRVVSPARP